MTRAQIVSGLQVAAMTAAHEEHARQMRAKGKAIPELLRAAKLLAQKYAPQHDTGAYCLTDTTPIYARRLLLQATIEAFGGSDEGKVLRALDAWLAIALRQCFYTEADAAALQAIKADLIEATEAVAEAMDALGDRIDGE